MKVSAWIRATALSSGLLAGAVPCYDERYRAAFESLDEQDRFKLEAALRAAHAHYKTASDIFGVVGIPLFLGLFAAIGLTEVRPEALAAYGGILLFYFCVYSYYRMMQGTAESLAEVGSLIAEARHGTESHAHGREKEK
ncbi:hypothetical protein [Raoultibacter phocaeensis]|uniref:hypothetical protein n=1 Tax=Raoultibacter phocaeensis TaxID=2479841 RepID=UPI00111BB52F|nr:hypothetical protein [Raoultibacter phocaeensis]